MIVHLELGKMWKYFMDNIIFDNESFTAMLYGARVVVTTLPW